MADYILRNNAVDTVPAKTAIELPATVGDIAIAHSKETDSLEAFIITEAIIRLYDTQGGYTVDYKAVHTDTTETIEFNPEDIGFGKKVVIGSLHVEGGL